MEGCGEALGRQGVDQPLTAAALAVWASSDRPNRLTLRRHPRWSQALAALDTIVSEVASRSRATAEATYRAIAQRDFNDIPAVIRSRAVAEPPGDLVAAAIEAAPFGDQRLIDLIAEAKQSLERAALSADPRKAIGAWLDTHGARLERAALGAIGDHALSAGEAARVDLIDPRFREDS